MPAHLQGNQGRREENDARKKSQTAKPGAVSRPAGIDVGVVRRTRLDPRRLSSADVLQLQCTIGNRAVSRLPTEVRQPHQPIQKQETETSLPDNLKTSEAQEAKPSIFDLQSLSLSPEAQREAMSEDKDQAKSTLQHQEIIGGGENSDLKSALNGARESGQPLDDGLQRSKDSLQGMGMVQRNVLSGQAAQHDWNAKHVPKRVKEWAKNAPEVVGQQYRITLSNMASNPLDQGDGVLRYLHGWNHKRFSGQYCLLYKWAPRRDENGWFLNVKGIGRKSGTGNDYDLYV